MTEIDIIETQMRGFKPSSDPQPTELITAYPRWRTLAATPFSGDSITDLFLNRIPEVCLPKLLSLSECEQLVRIIKTHRIGSYPVEDIWPPVGTVGIAFNHEDKDAYFAKRKEANLLQERFRNEAGVDVVERVRTELSRACGIPVRAARAGTDDYFVGLLRLVNHSAKLHADYGPFDAPEWEIGRISAQLTWNVLLRDVQGGECIVHNRPWEGNKDDSFRNEPPDYGYGRCIVEGCQSRSMKYQVGDVHLFNSRNIHEVGAVADPEASSRYTMSSFVGFLSGGEERGAELIIWS